MYYMKKTLFNTEMMRVSFLILILLIGCRGDQIAESEAYLSHFIADLWLEGADVMKIIWRACSKKLVEVKDVIDYKDYFPKFLRCMKNKTLTALDRSLDCDIIPIAEGVNLVRLELVDGTGNATSNKGSSSWTEKQIEGEWRSLALQRIAKILRTHVIKIEFDDTKMIDGEFRGRRRHHIMTMMVFGIVSIGMILVPMGFQFLGVLGGKALLLAKMALILASIQGLKKIASSPLNYGFYHSYPFEHYEKRSIDDWPSSTVTPFSLSSSIIPHNSPSKSNSMSDKDEDRNDQTKTTEHEASTTWKTNIIENTRVRSEAKLYSVYPGILPSEFPSADVSSIPVVDFTLSPSEVQADYTLEMPYNRFRSQSSTPIVPS